MRIRWPAASPTIVLALALALGVTACGGDDSGGRGEAQAAGESENALLAFARCMREQGVDVPDPQEGRLAIRPRRGSRPSESERREFEDADSECRHLLADVRPPELSQDDRAALQDSLLAFARCMRKQGVEVPDPDFSGDRGAFRVGPGGVNPDDPDFEEAQEACREHLRPLEERRVDRRSSG